MSKLDRWVPLKKSPEYEEVISQHDNDWSLSENVMTKLEVFMCVVYGKLRIKDVTVICFMKINEICKGKEHEASLRNVDMTLLPPCRRTLEQHAVRVNYQVAIWK